MANELILIVEDNEKNLKLVRDVPQLRGYQSKPIKVKELMDVIREMLDRRGAK